MGSRRRALLTATAFVLLLSSSSVAPASAGGDPPAYLALGDSLAFGVGAANPAAEGYVGVAHFTLTTEGGSYESGLELVNLAEPGATSADLLAPKGQLEQALAEIEERETDDIDGNEVQFVSIDVGGNDLLSLADPDSVCLSDASSEDCRDAINDTLNGLQENLSSILAQLRAALPESGIYVINLYNPYSGTGDPREVLASVGVQQVNGVINATASDPELGTTLVSIFEMFLGRGDQWIATDRIHPNNDGHRVIAEALVASIEERPVTLPEDLAAIPTGAPAGVPGDAAGTADGGDGFSDTLVYALIAAAFIAGLAVSATYFWLRGRSV